MHNFFMTLFNFFVNIIIHHKETGDEGLEKRVADTTRKIAALRSNEALMVRRYKAIEDSEMSARRECAKLREEVVRVENAVVEKIGVLQRYAIYCMTTSRAYFN